MKGINNFNRFIGNDNFIKKESINNLDDKTLIRKTFTIPVGNLSKEEAEVKIREIMKQYKEPLDIDNNYFIPIKNNEDVGEIWIPVSEKDDEILLQKTGKYLINNIEEITPKVNVPWYNNFLNMGKIFNIYIKK